MGDRTNFTIEIVAATPRQWRKMLPIILDHVGDHAPDYGDPVPADPARPDERYPALSEDRVTLGQYGWNEAPCGTVSELAGDLVEAAPGAAWVMWEDPAYEWLGEVAAKAPRHKLYQAESDANGRPVLAWEEMQSAAGKGGRVSLAAVRRAYGRPVFDALARLRRAS